MECLRARLTGVRVRGLQLAGPEQFAAIKVGEDSKRKHYRALCWAARPLQHADVQVCSPTSPSCWFNSRILCLYRVASCKRSICAYACTSSLRGQLSALLTT